MCSNLNLMQVFPPNLLPNHTDSEEQDIRDKGWFIFSIKFTWKISMVCAANRDHVDACSLCCCQSPCWWLWSMLTLQDMLMLEARLMTGSYGQGGFFCSSIDDSRLITDNKKQWGFFHNPSPPKNRKGKIQYRKEVI